MQHTHKNEGSCLLNKIVKLAKKARLQEKAKENITAKREGTAILRFDWISNNGTDAHLVLPSVKKFKVRGKTRTHWNERFFYKNNCGGGMNVEGGR